VRVCIVGASGKLGRYMVQHALDRNYEVVGVCRQQSLEKRLLGILSGLTARPARDLNG
jgi:putative NADH-flavin reductase